MTKEEQEDKEVRDRVESVKYAFTTLDEMINNKPEMDVIKDNEICYGSKKPLCGQELGGKGLIKDKSYITCPECLDKLKKK